MLITISITSIISRVFERLITKHITLFLLKNSLLSKHQFGFMSGKSVELQLLACLNKYTSAINDNKYIDIVYFDLKKAFYKVSNIKLLIKLKDIFIIDLFADDTKIHLQSNNISDRQLMQLAINQFLSWSKNWQLDIAPNKTNIMSLNSSVIPTYYIESKLINNCISNKDLGILFDNYLYFDKHIIECCRGALMTINNLFRCFITSDV